MGLCILQLVTRRQHRGAEVFAASLSKELISRGQQLFFVGLYPAPEQALFVEGAANSDLEIDPSRPLSLRGVRKLASLIQRIDPDVIQANGSDTLKYAIAAQFFSRKRPLLYRNISIVSVWSGAGGWKRWLYQQMFKRVDFVTSVGEQSRADFIRFFDFPPNRISVIRRGVAVKAVDKHAVRASLQCEFGFAQDDFVVMHVGSFSLEKNHSFLLDVWSQKSLSQLSFRLVLVGEGGERTRLEAEVQKRGLGDRIFFAGFRSVTTLLPGADLLVLCSHVEGVPGVVLEAATFRIPTVAVNVGGVGEVVMDGETGVLLPSHDAALFADSIVRLSEDRSQLKALGDKAFGFVASDFDPAKNAGEFEALYMRLVQGIKKK
jgi:glycosyltransferase involved in cell wall biosynthesis